MYACRMSRGWVFVIGLLVAAPVAWGAPSPLNQAPAIQQNSPSNGHNQAAKPDHQSAPVTTAPIPVVVSGSLNITPTEERHRRHETQSDSKKSFWDFSLTDVLIALFTLALVYVGNKQWNALKDQVGRLDRTIEKADAASERQAREMKDQIAQATRSADAMQGVATAMGTNVVKLEESVGIQREIADRQKQVSEMQLRAYLSVVIGDGIYQEREKELRFEGRSILVNQGPTPARKVSHISRAGIFPVPLPEGFVFPDLPGQKADENMIGPNQNRILSAAIDGYVDDGVVDDIKKGKGRGLYIWGAVTYEDAFEQKRETLFCHLITWLPNDKVWGYYIPNRNSAT